MCIGQEAMNILIVVIGTSMGALGVLAMWEESRDVYRNLKESLEKEKASLQKQGLYIGLKYHFKRIRIEYILSFSAIIIWNVGLLAVVIIGIDRYYYRLF